LNRVLRRIFGPNREQVAGGWNILHNEELHNLYAPLNIIRAVESRRMRWEGHVTSMRENTYKFLYVKPEGRGPIERPRLGGKI